MRKSAAIVCLCAASAGLTAFSPPPSATLAYHFEGLLQGSETYLQPVQPGQQYPAHPEERTLPPVIDGGAAAPVGRRTEWTLTVDASVTADSNVTNGTRLHTVPIDSGSGPLPVPLDPNLREKEGVGLGLSGAGSVKVPVSPTAALSLGAEGYVLDYSGSRSDDASALLSAGVDLTGSRGSGTLQLIAFDRWYGGESAMRGGGVRANWKEEIAPGQHVGLYLDARVFDSGYGGAFGGKSGGAYLVYDAVIDPTLTAAGGLYVRRDWLHDPAYSSTEIGTYGSLTHYLTDDLTGGLTAGLSRVLFDKPVTYLSPEARRDWRSYVSLYLTTRRPVGWGVYPSLTYTYSRTASAIGFYRSDRHRLRVGLAKSF